MTNDNRDPFREFNRRVQRKSNRHQDLLSLFVVLALAAAIALVAIFAFG